MTRELLPQRRMALTIEFDCGPHHYTATLGCYHDGSVGEVFLNSGKAGTDLDIATRDSAIAMSLALQHGVSLETMRAAFLRSGEGEPEGPLAMLVDLLCEHGVQPQ